MTQKHLFLLAITLAMLSSLAHAKDLYLEEDFTNWPAVNVYQTGARYQNNWRFFSVSGAGGKLKCLTKAGSNYVRITRTSAAGDSGLDRDQPDQTLLIPPGSQVVVRVWARRVGATATLDLRLAEYQDLTWTGADHAQQFTLSDSFAPYTADITTGANANRLNVALRTLAGQSIEVNRIEVVPYESVTNTVPRILLPQGWTPNAQPVLWWRAVGHGQYQVQLASDLQFTTITWDSGAVVSGSNHATLPSQTAGQRIFARVRVQGFAGTWSGWSDPTTILYDPLPQLPQQDLYVYSIAEINGLTAEQSYEQGLFHAALQGLVNRKGPRLFYLGANYSQEWPDKLSQPGRWMEKVRQVKNAGAQAKYQKISTTEGPALRMNRQNMTGDTGVDHGTSQTALTVTSNTLVRVTCRARAISIGAQLRLDIPEYDPKFHYLTIPNVFQTALTGGFQDYSFSFTTGQQTRLINPAMRVGNIGVIDVKSIRVTIDGATEDLLNEDFEVWTNRTWETPGTWYDMAGWRIFGTNSPDVVALAARYPDAYSGVVLWDPAVPATSNIAAMIAGVENLLPIPLRDEPGSLYRMFVTGGPHLTVKRSLVGKFTGSGNIPDTGEPSSGSAKNDAYRWAIAQYMLPAKCDPAYLGYYGDAYMGLYNNTACLDFWIMNKGFPWDLSVWDDETPIDDPGQPIGTDVITLKRLLATAATVRPNTILRCGGFPPFMIKYSNFSEPPFNAGGTHEPVPTEWKFAEIISGYNAEMEADGYIVNASVYAHMPRWARINQMPPPTFSECRDAGWITASNTIANRAFVQHYVGDYDSPSWITSLLPPLWDNGLRGSVLVSWALDPNMCERGMPQFDEWIRYRTPNDPLWCGDSGAGYTNPNQFFAPRDSGLPDGSEAWRAHCAKWFRMFDIRHTGFIINGNKEPSLPAMRALYESFSGDGIVDGWTPPPRMTGTMPSVQMSVNVMKDDPDEAADESMSLASAGSPSFLTLRSILKDPTYYYQLDRSMLVNHAEKNPAFVSPAEFFYLFRFYRGAQNHYRASFLGDTVTSGSLAAGSRTHRKLWLRNLGWQSWPSSGGSAIRVGVELSSAEQRGSPVLINLPHDVASGQMVEVEFDLDAPLTQGLRYWRIDLCEGASTWFGDHGNLPESRAVWVGAASTGANDWNQFK